jgi:two-component system, OmpR family, KDP operon response regulator KdpE
LGRELLEGRIRSPMVQQEATTILVVDDDPDVLELVATRIGGAGYRPLMAPSAEEALKVFFARRPDLVILDVDMPGMGGLALCGRIREVSDVPVMFLSALGAESDRVKGLQAGGDDYIVKPFLKEELLARIRASLRRAAMPPVKHAPDAYSDSELTLDERTHAVIVRGKPVALSPREYRVLTALVRHAGHVLSQEQLLSLAWGAGAEDASAESVRLYISYLRAKIEEQPRQPRLIETVREFGYRYVRPADRARAA